MKSVMALVLAGSGLAVAQDAVQWRVEDGGNGHWYAVYPSEVSGCAGGACRADLLTLLNEYGPCPPPCRSDLNGDGVVDFADALRLLSAWGSCDG